mmetsp:Transcript_6413/g.22036  ORF Transcript_6413/g.22036 Transcript_6413/m.22036 type:complete len:84 (+) Transcript_6413:392-643(+)
MEGHEMSTYANLWKDYAGPEKLDIRTFTVVERTNKGINLALAFLLVLDYMLSTGSMFDGIIWSRHELVYKSVSLFCFLRVVRA